MSTFVLYLHEQLRAGWSGRVILDELIDTDFAPILERLPGRIARERRQQRVARATRREVLPSIRRVKRLA